MYSKWKPSVSKIMPDINVDPISRYHVEERQFIPSYVPGYDWVPGNFGPPPGIPKTRKDQLGRFFFLILIFFLLSLI